MGAETAQVRKDEALARGLPHYFTGKPCKYGHIAPRFTSSGNCTVCHSMRSVKYRNAKFKNSGILVSREFNRVHEKYVDAVLGILEAPVSRPGLVNLNERAVLRMLLDVHLAGGSVSEFLTERAWGFPLPPGTRATFPPGWGVKITL